MDRTQNDSLTPKEREVLTLLAKHARIGEVANALGTSPHTVNTQLKSARRKLGVADSLTAARMYVATGDTQSLSNSPLVIDLPVAVPPSEWQEQAGTPASGNAVLHEERAVFDLNALDQQAAPPDNRRGLVDDLKTPRAVLAPKLQTIFNLAILVLALLALAPVAGRGLQSLIDAINPPH